MKASLCWLMAASLAAVGCAHHHGNTYAYAPPYAPPVYPQPPVAQPVSYGAPVAGPPVVTMPGPAAGPAGVVVAGQTSPCPQGCPEGTVTTAGVVMDAAGQTPPCPPGP